ncbi:TetR/AcrR family transcriptional regulator [Actinomadura rugatobispora]|uniref:TetR/AcrR family transcriptional regulator n=1 Tax=Actinomadura rugatobispora TaxID=1994 RepID=A0ABW0ZRH4_9ACTN|nr:TetR/AcrR family transcriptional regulator [Actinomadura rugatobispora]
MSDPRPGRDSKTRAVLIEAATQLLLEEGYAAVTTRKVAAKAGVNQALVYYYFRTMDELFLAVFRRGADATVRRLERAAEADQPLRALWEVSSEPRDSALTIEFLALAHHRQVVHAELVAYTRRYRRIQKEILEHAVKSRATDGGGPTPSALAVLTVALSRGLAMDGMLGITDGHDEILSLVEEQLARFEPLDDDPRP